MLKANKLLKNSDGQFLVLVGYVIAIVLGLSHHEMWRDEYVEFLQARDTQGLLGLGNTMSQGHAMLWQTCLWVVIRFTHNPVSMQIIHACIAIGSAYLLIYKSPFKLWQSALLLTGYFFLFEYSLISRCYAFGVLFLFLFAHIYSKGQFNWKSALCIFLLANTSVYGMMLAGALCFWVFLNEIVLNTEKISHKLKRNVPLFLLSLMGIVIAMVQIMPQEDNTYPLKLVTWPFDYFRFKVAISQLFHAFLPIPDFSKVHFWNTNFLLGESGPNNWYWAIAVLVIVSLPFLKHKSLLFLWLSGITVLLFFQYMTGFRFARYYGNLYIWWLICLWFLQKMNDTESTAHQWLLAVLVFMMAIPQTIGGVGAYIADWNKKFSRGKDAARYLQKNGFAKTYMVGTVDFALSPITAELDRKIYTMQHKSLQSYTKWDKKRLNSMDSLDLVEALSSGPLNEPVIFIATHPVPQFEYFKAREERRKIPVEFDFGEFKIRRLAYFKQGIEYNEGYWIFRVDKKRY